MRVLVVGQGIAGTVLAWTLRRMGADVRVADSDFPNTASSVAAGIINPVTGKRYVKTWRYDDFFPAAKAAYTAIQAELGVTVWHDQSILRLLETPQERNDWSVRLADPEYADLLGERPDAGPWSQHLVPGFAIGEIRGAARVDFGLLISSFRNFVKDQGFFLPQKINPEAAQTLIPDYDCIVFCEGYRGAQNPFFPILPWQLSKGEAMLVRLKTGPVATNEMLKKTILLAPLPNGLCWAGASYNWTFDDNGPTEFEQNFLEERLAHYLRSPYEVVQRLGAVRPTVRDRRPFLGASQSHPSVFIFNGLGTKGALLAPYWSEHLAEHLLYGKALDGQVRISERGTAI
ncbi:MAG: NAD(P)/FAD-dependent oxidoreductase [Saprospiraceae bacterium]